MSSSDKLRSKPRIGKINSPFLDKDKKLQSKGTPLTKKKKKKKRNINNLNTKRKEQPNKIQKDFGKPSPQLGNVTRRLSEPGIQQPKSQRQRRLSEGHNQGDLFVKPKGNYNDQVTTWQSLMEQGSIEDNPFIKGIVEVLNKQQWKDEEKDDQELPPPPNIKIATAEKAGTTQAFYDRGNNTITVSVGPLINAAALWDQVLFETQNAINGHLFNTLDNESNSKASAKYTPTQYGKQKALIEFKSDQGYIRSLRQIIAKKKLTLQDTAPLAYGALLKDEATKHHVETVKQDLFTSSPHDPAQKGQKRGLSSADLYAYEQVEGFQNIEWVGARVRTHLNQALKGLSELFGVHELWTDVIKAAEKQGIRKWPEDTEKKEAQGDQKEDQASASNPKVLRPAYYVKLIEIVEKELTKRKRRQTENLFKDNKKVIQWNSIMKQFQALKLSNAATELAKKEAEKHKSSNKLKQKE